MPSKKQVIWNVTHPRNLFFTGRTQLLGDLHHALTATGKVALSGMGGIGKTQTAVEYAYQHRGEYGAVLWVKADSEDSLKTDYAAIAAKLNLPEKEETDRDVVVAAVKRWLEAHAGWLMILDNADDLDLVSDLLRREWDGHILLTTRAHATGGVSRVEITEMTPDEGTLFLLRRAKLITVDDELGAATEADREIAWEITREMDGLPLALDQAGAFIEEMSSSLTEYLELYRSAGVELRAKRGGIISDHDPVTITFSLAFQQVASASAAAADMLRVCAFLASDVIPEEVFVSGAGELGENLAPMAGGGINLVKMMGEAGRFSLIRRNAKNGTIEIHRVVQQVLNDEMDEETQRLWAERVVRALNASFSNVDLNVELNNWLLCEKLLPHAQEAGRIIEENSFDFIDAGRLMLKAGYYCNERAQYAEAEPLLTRALSIYEKALGSDHPDSATCLNNLGLLYSNQGKYVEAEPLFERALSIQEKALGPNHPSVAVSLNNLGLLYDNQGKYAEVEPLLRRALSIRENTLEPDHPKIARCLNNLGLLYDSQGKYVEAEPLLQRALSIYEKALGPDHVEVGMMLNNLAVFYNHQSNHTKAEPLLTRALSIYEKALGSDHPDTAKSLNNLGLLYSNQGKYVEAEPLFERALNIQEKALGPNHPDTAKSLNNLAVLYANQSKYAEAEPPFRRALNIQEKALGPDHPTSLLLRKNYLALLERMEDETEK